MPTLLVADDSMFQRFVISKVARQAGYDVLEAKNGEECLELARTGTVDGMLMDINMPGRSGLEVMQELNNQGIKKRVIVITGDIQDSTKSRCMDLGAAAIINKPFDEEMLQNKIVEVFSSQG